MEREELTDFVIRSIREIQDLGGRPNEEIGPDTCPIGDLEEFDSLNAAEAASLLSGYLDHLVDERVFVASDTGRALTVGEIVEGLAADLGGREGVA